MSKTLTWPGVAGARPPGTTLLLLAAAALHAASQALTRIAAARAAAGERASAPQRVEFHALYGDAGAPEGALYVDGKLVGVIEGVSRL